jgi:hypothetical protein
MFWTEIVEKKPRNHYNKAMRCTAAVVETLKHSSIMVWMLCTEIEGNCREKPRKMLKRRKWTVH